MDSCLIENCLRVFFKIYLFKHWILCYVVKHIFIVFIMDFKKWKIQCHQVMKYKDSGFSRIGSSACPSWLLSGGKAHRNREIAAPEIGGLFGFARNVYAFQHPMQDCHDTL